MTDDTQNDIAPPTELPAALTVLVDDLKKVMAAAEHDVSGQCWYLWSELKALVDKAAV